MTDFKVCLYLEQEKFVKVSGIGTAFEQQKKCLEKADVNYTTNLKEDFDILHINFVGPRSYYLAEKYKRRGKKIVMHTHTTAEDFKNSFRGSNLIKPLLKRYLVRYYNKADLLIAPSEYTKNLMQNKYGLKNKRIIAISNGVDFDKFGGYEKLREEYRKKYNLKGVVCFSVGHVFKRKGVNNFINIAKRMPDVQFIWFGRIYNRVLSNANSLTKQNIPNVAFSGYVEDIRGAYAAGDIFIFPSYGENQGIVILEAAATKHPLIVRNLPTYKGWLHNNKNAIICKNDKEFQSAIQRLIKNKSIRERLAKNAYEMSKEHSLEKVGKQLKAAYESLL